MGLAVHFRCERPDVQGMRIDVMSVLRGVDPYPVLWGRRTTAELEDDVLEVLSLPDLVRAKKTHRDRDWPMITRLVEASFFEHQDDPSPEQVEFWLRELRTTELLVEVAARFPDRCRRLAADRPLLALAAPGGEEALRSALRAEEEEEREADRRYWRPLKEELARLRRERRES